MDAWVDAPVRLRIDTPSAMASRNQNMWDLLGPSYAGADPPRPREMRNRDASTGAAANEGGGGCAGGASAASTPRAAARPISAPAYRAPRPPPRGPPPPVTPAQNIITNHLPLGTHPRPTTCSLEREPETCKPSPSKPSIKEIDAGRERVASAREARVRAVDRTRIDKPLADGTNSVCVPSAAAPSSWVETTQFQSKRDVAYRGRTHDVEAHYRRRRNKDFERDSARTNNRFARTDHIRSAVVARRGENLLLPNTLTLNSVSET